ncbi:MAG: FecR domain-containing protein, partial [Planctomycetales bacterium]|nr:FecR domain-containing protein [Planctomycetales bacterium]
MTENRPQSHTEDTCSQNIQRLLKHAYAPETPDADFATRVANSLQAAALERAATVKTSRPANTEHRAARHQHASASIYWQTTMLRVGSIAALFIVAIGMFYGLRPATDTLYRDGDLVWIDGRAYTPAETKGPDGFVPATADRINETTADVMRLVSTRGLTPRQLADPPTLQKAAVGDTISTSDTTRRRVTLPDGSVLYVNINSEAKIVGNRHVSVDRGEVFVEVNPVGEFDPESGQESRQRFVLTTPGQEIVALGTKFAVDVRQQATRVQVTQGKVAISPVAASETTTNANSHTSQSATTLVAGQQLTARKDALSDIAPAPPAAHELDWTRDLAATARSPLIPANEHTGGSLVVVDTQGQDVKLSLRNYHVDVYIEDGFARTTIDQTFFNHMPSRQEGTFYFPLPPDASLSRLAMYVNGKLMEGGMAERDYARQVFETIKYRQLDPALLEWVDGSTFKMRVFPLEPRREKRILISYTQRLPEIFGQLRYHFPAGHTMDQVRDWSAQIKIRHGDNWQWQSVSHAFESKTEQDDLILTAKGHDIRLDRDLLLELTPPQSYTPQATPFASFATTFHDGSQYLQLRYWPHLSLPPRRERRDWILLFEASGDRDPIVARAQVEILRSLLENAEHHDTFSLLTAGTRMHAWRPQASDATPENITEAIAWLENSHLVGAMDVERAYRAIAPLVDSATNPTIVHCGSAVPALGEREDSKLVELLPSTAEFVGVGVGKRWNRDLMKLAAERSGGFFTQINPDEDVSWRAFELLGKLNTPRLLNITVTADNHATGDSEFRLFETSLSAGESICAIARYESSATLPTQVTVRGQLDGQPFLQTIPVRQVAPRAEHLPRMWAKLEIQRLSAVGLLENKDRIIALS